MSDPARPKLSVTIITKNESAAIRDCLDSVVGLADEIVVLDSGSTDDTVAICRECTPHVFETDWPGFGVQKNRAVERATGESIFSIDADERVSPELRAEIEAAIRSPGENVAFRMPRLSKFCGRYMRHSGWRPDYVTRVFRKERGRFSDSLVHERVIVEGPVGTLQESIRHETFDDLEDVLEKMNSYSSMGARMLADRRGGGSLTSAVLHGGWSFFRTYLLKRGFLDGRNGFMLAVSNAEGTYYRYLKSMLLAERR